MTASMREIQDLDVSPIDLVEDIAVLKSWDVDRLGDDQIAMAVSGAWRTYSVSLAWCDFDETLRMVATFEMECDETMQSELYRAIETANDRIWLGGFNYWRDQSLMAFRYGLTLRGGASATVEQVDAMLKAALENCERYFPAFDLVAQNGDSVEDAISTALLEVAGRA